MFSLFSKLAPPGIFQPRAAGENHDHWSTANRFQSRYDGENATSQNRKLEATALTNEYYDLVTDFYEFGWGQAFHFATRFVDETFHESLLRHEHFLAMNGEFKFKDTILDIGCGVGGPLRNIVKFTQAKVIGINNNQYQIRRARSLDQKAGLAALTDYLRCDFNAMPLEDESIDGAYAIEATCHAGDKKRCFTEIFRTLKPGSCFVGFEWILTDAYNDENEEHRRVRKGIELGNALPSLATALEVTDALTAAGFDVEIAYDLIEKFEKLPAKQISWYQPLDGSYRHLSQFRSTPVGRWLTGAFTWTLEKLHIAPQGSFKTTLILEEAAENLVKGGKTHLFTPAFFFKARKPGKKT